MKKTVLLEGTLIDGAAISYAQTSKLIQGKKTSYNIVMGINGKELVLEYKEAIPRKEKWDKLVDYFYKNRSIVF